MKKTESSIKENRPSQNTKKSQKKISLYFSKTTKDEACTIKNTLITDKHEESDVSTQKSGSKRKLLGELAGSQSKIIKYDNVLETHKYKKLEEPLNKSNIVRNACNDSSDKEIIMLEECNKDISLGGCKDESHDKPSEKRVQMKHDSFMNFFMEKDNNGLKQSDEFNKCQNKSDFILESSNDFACDDFNDWFEEAWSPINQINFDSLQRCKVVHVKRECSTLLLTVEQECSASSGTVSCSGFWKDAKIEEGDIIAIQARKETPHWIVDNTSGFLVVHPDTLISGTTVVGALFCRRRAVLAEKFKKLESLPYFKGDQTAMVIGSLAHQLLQKAMHEDIHEMSDIKKLLFTLLESRETASTLYASEVSLRSCKEQMLTLIPRIYEFIQHYIKDKKHKDISMQKYNFKGNITHVYDIEENIWLPELGIKGKVDATVEVNLHSKRKIMPLEIKTGKASFSSEHRGQIILYIMMMALTGQDIDTGLLLYLRENSMQEIKAAHPEKRDLILLRNTLAHYFSPKSVESSPSESNWQTLELPEPINHHSACSTCSYNALCCAYLSRDMETRLSESHPLIKLSKEILGKIKPEHIDYVIKWIALLRIEESAQCSNNIMRYLWTLSPEKREAKKLCISGLKVIGKVVEYDSKYRHTFVRTNHDQDSNIPYLEFVENEYILVSTNKRINISAGFIMHIKEDSVTVLLDRDITKYNIDESFHIDKYSSSNLIAFNFANVGGLMGDNEICEKLREIVIDKKPATFAKELSKSVISISANIVERLNEDQARAVLKAMTAKEYILIKGMPGTGKTQTLVALIQLLNAIGCSILITAHTNSAVDNVLLRLLDKGIDFLRLGSSSIHPTLKHKTESYATANCCSPNSFDAVYSSKNIIGVTCYGAHHALLGRRIFDVCVIDESSQALQPVVLRPLYSARKFVLVGDPDQLPPIIKSRVARKLGADESLFARLDSNNNTVNLTKQYRMNKNIMQLANKLTYNDMLEAGNLLVENATLNTIHVDNLSKHERWMQKVLSSNTNDSVIILNTGRTSDLKTPAQISDKYPKIDQKISNIWEAVIIFKLLKTLLEIGIKAQDIGVIAPYRAHVNLLKEIVQKDVEMNTVDQYQGRDKDVIIYTCSKSVKDDSDIKEDIEILGDHRRLTVAITRAKHKLIVIADKYTLSNYSAFKKLFSLVEAENIVDLCDGQHDFSWDSLMSQL
ncbi:DNA replication helicase/nuclease 2 [Megalopta genalis]|uniref:DNA replication helicase/nuclease 2 n=1 Tax=Megalopta genalis TaxID=115081 RepID=UPI003FD08C26